MNKSIENMEGIIRTALPELIRFLNGILPKISENWWDDCVVRRLSFQQQRMVQERGHRKLEQLDFAALLRIFDQNWHDFGSVGDLPREGRTWVKELQTVRNKWAHLSAETIPASEVYRDADTLGRFLGMIGSGQSVLDAIEATKSSAIAAMAKRDDRSIDSGMSAEESSTPGEEQSPGTATAVQTTCSLFAVGDLVSLRSDPSIVFPVIEVMTGSGECRYKVFYNNSKVTYYESQLAPVGSEEEGREVITAAEVRARLTSLHISSPSTANLFSLRSGRVHFVPYQYRPVLKLIRADRPRLLIADEVGVGKTIEAGLIIKELKARLDLSSVLIICPKALVSERKWYHEMKRFDETFTALDGGLLRHCLRETQLDGEWPDQFAKAIIPFSLFDSNLVYGKDGNRNGDDGLVALNPPPKFDLVIVDEAHHIRNSETYLHQGVRYFCDNADAVLFLSATPVQLGSNDLYTLLNVLRPDLIIDPASFEQMAEPNRYINSAIRHCRGAGEGWQELTRAELDGIANTEWGRLFLLESPGFQAIYDRLGNGPLTDEERVGTVRSLEEIYTFSALINRTRRRDIGEFTTRKPDTVSVEFTPQQRTLHDSLLSLISRILEFCHGQQNVKFMMTTIRRQTASCIYGLAPLLEDILNGQLNRLELLEVSDGESEGDVGFVAEVRAEIEGIVDQARSLDPSDPKVEAFVKVLIEKNEMPNNKALVFSTFRHTLAYLADNVSKTKLRYGLIHGGVGDDERASLRRRFSLPKADPEAIDVLLSSEVGCEGLDFQFCDFLINYDLPWNPMRIEQRIGRIDRYGQKSETVGIINFITPGTVDAEIYDRCLWRIGVFQHAIGGNEEILGEISSELREVAESFNLTGEERKQRLRQLADNGINRIQEEQKLEAGQAELFGLNIPAESWQKEVEEAETYWLSSPAIERCVVSYLSDRLGEETGHLLGDKSLKTLRIGQDGRSRLLDDFQKLPRSTDPVSRQWEKWLKGGQPTLSVTFDQKASAEDPNTIHLSVTHPLVRQAARCLQPTEPQFASLSANDTKLPAGAYRFALYRWSIQGVRTDERLVSVASEPVIEEALLDLVQAATEAGGSLPDQVEFDELDARHHSKWTAALADHIAENKQQVHHRIQSLKISHRARCKAIEDQITRATNDKIRLMKQSELGRANADFDRRMAELEQTANSGDIHATPILFGTITITGN